MLFCIYFLFVFIFTSPNPSLARDISLTITQKNLQESVLISVANTSAQEVVLQSVEIELNKRKYLRRVGTPVKAGAVAQYIFSIQPPEIRGSYILETTVRYLNEGTLLTVKHADFYHREVTSLASEPCRLEVASKEGKNLIILNGPQTYSWRLVVPDEISVHTRSVSGNAAFHEATSSVPEFSTVNRIFATTEGVKNNLHQAQLCSAVLTLTPGRNHLSKGKLPGYFFLICAILFFTGCAFLIAVNHQPGKIATLFIRYGSRMFFLGLCCWALKESNHWLTASMYYLPWAPYLWLARTLLDNINGGNYRYFFQFFVDGYFLLCLLVVFPCLYWFDRKKPAAADKYVAFFTTLLTLPGFFAGKKPHWNDLARLGLFTIMVKFFFVPLMVSWAIGGVYNTVNGLRSLEWNVFAINAYLVQLLLLVDTVIFSLGYLVESKYLNNEIKSVEPTFLGWLVCLWCYPPFNTFSFKPFDFYIIRVSLPYPAWLNVFILCTITCLWALFVWASVSLGFKASNLTNRGIVRSGPYRYVRHPAYTAKLMIWILQGVFFAHFGIFILFGFIVIYVLRAWTEEKHLSRDPDYLAYKQSVRWGFIPGII